MLTESDKLWIKENRAQITEGRTVAVTLVMQSKVGEDPFTKEPIVSDISVVTSCVWRIYQAVSRTQIQTVNGITVEEGDVEVKFGNYVDVRDAKYIVREGVRYRVVSVNAAGIGEEYRFIALLRKVT